MLELDNFFEFKLSKLYILFKQTKFRVRPLSTAAVSDSAAGPKVIILTTNDFPLSVKLVLPAT